MKSESSRSAKQPAAKRSASSVKYKTDWARLSFGAGDTATPEHPEADMHHAVPGIFRHGLQLQPAP